MLHQQRSDLIGRLAERLIMRHLRREDEPTGPVPASVGPFQVLREVARAPYGQVFLALDPEEEETVLVRVLARGRVRFADGFPEHVSALAAFEDPGVVSLRGAGIAEEQPFFVMESLSAPLLADCSLTITDRVAVVEDVARSLNVAHERGLVHGDLNPTNIHVGERTMVRDLGIAALVVDEKVRVYLGTLGFLAPEQLSGGEVGPWTDVHALGAVLYWLLAGRTPFEGAGVRTTVERIRCREVDPPSDHASHVPPELERVALRALAKRPEERYPSALDMARDLLRWRMRNARVGRLARSA